MGLILRDSLSKGKKEKCPYNQSPRVTNVLVTIFLPKIFSSVAYGTSHIGIIALTRVLARTITADPRGDILINSVSTKVKVSYSVEILSPISYAESLYFLVSGWSPGETLGQWKKLISLIGYSLSVFTVTKCRIPVVTIP